MKFNSTRLKSTSSSVRNEPVRNEPVRNEPVRNEPVRTLRDRPVRAARKRSMSTSGLHLLRSAANKTGASGSAARAMFGYKGRTNSNSETPTSSHIPESGSRTDKRVYKWLQASGGNNHQISRLRKANTS